MTAGRGRGSRGRQTGLNNDTLSWVAADGSFLGGQSFLVPSSGGGGGDDVDLRADAPAAAADAVGFPPAAAAAAAGAPAVAATPAVALRPPRRPSQRAAPLLPVAEEDAGDDGGGDWDGGGDGGGVGVPPSCWAGAPVLDAAGDGLVAPAVPPPPAAGGWCDAWGSRDGLEWATAAGEGAASGPACR